MKIFIDNALHLQHMPSAFQRTIMSRLTIDNPVWIENERMGRWNSNTSKLLQFYELTSSGIIIPRGCYGTIQSYCDRHDMHVEVEDHTTVLPPVSFSFTGKLRGFQDEAGTAMASQNFGTLTAPPGCGKTVMALALIAKRKQPVLIVVHTKELLNQWVDRIGQFLSISAKEVGIIGGGKKRIGEKITVATVQSLVKIAEEVSPHIGHLIIDEVHHCPSRTFTEVVTAFNSHYMLGLSATPWRRDGLSKLIFWYVGDVVHEVRKQEMADAGKVVPFEVIQRETGFTTSFDGSTQYSKMLSELTEDPERNRVIVDSIVNDRGAGISLVLSDRKAHCEELSRCLSERGIRAGVLTGGCTPRERQEIVARMNAGKVQIIIATGQLIGEGFDCCALSTLFITTPIRFDGRLIQYMGRVLRPAPGKDKARIIDFVDTEVGVLKAAARAREIVYVAGGAL